MFKVETKHPIATFSPDHMIPYGTKEDNSRNLRFNQKLNKKVFSYNDENLDWLSRLYSGKIMDWGCAGGAFVKDCIDDGHHAIGLEGSDYSKKHNRAAWSCIPNHLFTCDITKPFQVTCYDCPEIFDVITAWEFIEHIKEEDLEQVFINADNHLKKDGLWIMTVATHVDGPYHQTIRDPGWWFDLFKQCGWEQQEDLVNYFAPDWIRRPEYPVKIENGQYVDRKKNGFHVVLKRK